MNLDDELIESSHDLDDCAATILEQYGYDSVVIICTQRKGNVTARVNGSAGNFYASIGAASEFVKWSTDGGEEEL